MPSLLKPLSTFEEKTLRNERLRALIVAIVLASMIILASIYVLSDGIQIDILENANLDYSLFLIILTGVLLFEIGVIAGLSLLLKRRRSPPLAGRYVNALVETSIITIALWLIGDGIGDYLFALTIPPAMLYAAFIILSILRLSFWLSFFTGLVAAGGVLLLILSADGPSGPNAMDPLHPYFVAKIGMWLLLGVIAGLIGLQLRRQVAETIRFIEERNSIRELFGNHVSPSVVDKLLSIERDDHTELRDVCVMFLDIRNFTSFSESRKPTDVVDYLNVLFNFMIDSVNHHDGIINKFLGDGFMAVFGAPLSTGKDTQQAVNASLDIIAAVNRLSESGQIPPTRVGIGLHRGEAITGTVGSKVRKEYTIIGDTVNVASRVESLNKQFDSQILVTTEVWESIDTEKTPGERLDDVMVKGRQTPVSLYKLA